MEKNPNSALEPAFLILCIFCSIGLYEHAYLFGSILCIHPPLRDRQSISGAFRFFAGPLSWLLLANLPPLACLIPASTAPPSSELSQLVVIPNNYDLWGTVTLSILFLSLTVALSWGATHLVPLSKACLVPYVWWVCFCILSLIGDHQGILNRFPLLTWYAGPLALLAPLGVGMSQFILSASIITALRSTTWLIVVLIFWFIPVSIHTQLPPGLSLQALVLPTPHAHLHGEFTHESVEKNVKAHISRIKPVSKDLLYVSPEGALPALNLSSMRIDQLHSVCRNANVGWLVGTWKEGLGALQHDVFLFGGDYVQRTGKSRLVPFFEHTQIWRRNSPVRATPSQLLHWHEYRIGVVICYEMSASHIRNQFEQADLIIVLANYSRLRPSVAFDRWQTEQLERLRLETKKPVILISSPPQTSP